MTKKKRNARERRALVGALCTAAVIVAGSTFAWFTSSDEVTNRLTANADYGVSIVESFTPPANWIPGQNINKDVYAINTGNIPAFVNQDVSGVLTYTVEQKVATPDANCVKLTADEVDVMKAGAYLAGAFAQTDGTALTNVTAGNIAEYFNNGAGTDPKTTDDFTPTTAGLYFFRRSIGVKAADQTETFTYQGYYFDGSGNYYKLADIRINEIPLGKANDGITADGNLTICPTVLYAKEETKTVTPTLRYEAAVTSGENTHKQRLVATAKTGTATDVNSLNGADVDSKAIAADNALETLNTAKANLDAAKAALDSASSGYKTAIATITYYAGATNAATITANDLSGLESINTSAPGALSADKVVANGVLRTKIDDYNSIVAATNALTEPAEYGNVSTLENTMSSKKTAMDTALTDFNNKKSAYEQAAGYPYTAPITNPAPEDSVYVVWTADNAYQTAKAAYETAKAAYDAAKSAADSYDAQKANYKAQLDQLKTAIDSDVANLKTAITARDNSDPKKATAGTQADYDTKLAAYNTALETYNTALANYNKAAAEYQAALGNGNDLEIYIYLSDAVVTSTTEANKWQLMPIVSGADGDTIAHFYYTGILEASKSSEKLIDSVELSKDVTQDMYKSFDFDLNVHLDSAQITYADDQKTITATAVNEKPATGESAFENRQANLTTPTSIATPVLWS